MENNQSTVVNKNEKIGMVVSDAMDKTIVVAVVRTMMHPTFKKIVRKTKKFMAHDETNQCQVGDRVRIIECRPLSRRKCWRLAEVIEKAK